MIPGKVVESPACWARFDRTPDQIFPAAILLMESCRGDRASIKSCVNSHRRIGKIPDDLVDLFIEIFAATRIPDCRSNVSRNGVVRS
jgi:hypothetical protein